ARSFVGPRPGNRPRRSLQPAARSPQPAVGMRWIRRGVGYWLIGADGGMFIYKAPLLRSNRISDAESAVPKRADTAPVRRDWDNKVSSQPLSWARKTDH